MVDTIHPVDAVAGSPSYGGRMLRQVNAVAFGGATAARPLGGRSGVRPGTSVTTVTATSTTWSCGPLSGVADVETAAEAGLVTFALDAVATGAITAASASFARQDLIYVQIDIPVEDGSAVPVVTRKYIAGTVASTDPALPVARAFAIARINVPISGGGVPTVTWIAPYAVAAGGILPVPSSASYPASPSVGQYADDAALGKTVRFNGSTWDVVAGAVVVGALGADGNATINYSKLTRTALGVVTVVGQSTRTAGSTYATALIVGILPAGFRPPISVQGNAATYGSGTPNQVTVNAATGVISLMTASPAGHTVAEFNLTFTI